MKLGFRFITTALAIGAISMIVSAAPDMRDGHIPKEGFVPTEKTAVAIAEAVLIPIIGEQRVKAEQPFKARLTTNEWLVIGSFPIPSRTNHLVGGVAEIRIDKVTGTIKSVKLTK